MILDNIVADGKLELDERKRIVPLSEIEMAAREQSPPLDFAAALKGEHIQLIAEVKKASPSRGIIRADFNPAEIAAIYADNGASAISVLTETKYFQGSIDYLRVIRSALGSRQLPLLRKDFIFDPYQIYEARAYGADALLLIVAMLMPEQLTELLGLSRELGMSCLVEVHKEAELEIALDSGTGIIGINNRDLDTFNVDLATTERLRPLIPRNRITVSESGIKNRSDMEKLKTWGIDAALIGEALMAAPDIAGKMKELL